MSLVAVLEVHRTAGNVCPVDLAPLFEHCGSILLSGGNQAQNANAQPSVISVTPTLPVSTNPLVNSHTQSSISTSTHAGNMMAPAPTGQIGSAPAIPVNLPAHPGVAENEHHARPPHEGEPPAFGEGPKEWGGAVHHHHPRSSCQPNDLLSIDVDLLGLDIDVDVYLNLLGGQSDSSGTTATRQYRTLCGQSLQGIGGDGATSTALDATDCLQQCEADALRLTAAVGALQDCLGATLTDGVSVDNCLYFVGDGESDLLDVDASVLTPDPDANSYYI